jgi:hypothetical protein
MDNQADEQSTSRRSFLKKSLMLGGGAALLGAGAFASKIASDYRMVHRQKLRPVAPEDIENKIVFHGEIFPSNTKSMFLEGKLTGVPMPECDVDIVIVGGGAAGLTAAYRLRDRDFLLLEALPELGGNSMYCEWEGVPFSLGGQYIGPPGTWADPVWDLCSELGLSPMGDPGPVIASFPGDLRIKNPFSPLGFLRMPMPLRVKRDMVRFFFLDFANIDVEKRKKELDNTPFSEFMKEYSPEFHKWFETSWFGHPDTDKVSAYLVIKELKNVEAAGGTVASLPGGLGRINFELARKIEADAPNRLLTGAFVFRVKHDENGRVLATYWHRGRVSTVRAKAAIINADVHIAKEILTDLPGDIADVMNSKRNISYPVFHYCFRAPIYQGGYLVGVMDCQPIQAITAPDWFSRDKGKDRANILSCFRILRASETDLLYDRNSTIRMVAETLSELDLRFSGAIEKLEAVHVFLRTRNFYTPQLGLATEMLPKLGKPYGSIFFANAEYRQPESLFPEAVFAANEAVEGVKKTLA